MRERKLGILSGLAVASALAALTAFLGEVRAPVPALCLLLLLGVLAGAFRPTRLALQWGSAALALLIAVCLLTPVLGRPLAQLSLIQSPVKSDAIVVLGGGVQCGTNTLESTSLSRLLGGLKLWRAGYAPVITVSEQSGLIGAPDCPKMSVLESGYIRALYPYGGPEVLTLRHVTTTKDEAARVKVLAAQRGWKQIIVVTSPWHSRRAAGLFRANGLKVLSVPTADTRFDESLPLPSDRLVALHVLTYEWLARLKVHSGLTPERD